MSVML